MMTHFVIDHCANCARSMDCDQAMKGRFCPGYEERPGLTAIVLRPATMEDESIKITAKIDFSKAIKHEQRRNYQQGS